MGLMTLTCDAAAKPVGLVPVREAVARVASALQDGLRGEAGAVQILLEDPERRFRSQHLDLAAPLVILEPSYIELKPRETERVSRRVLFARDGYRCQYCGYEATPGRAARELTVDHVKPAHLFPSRAAATSWENTTTACFACNQRKGGLLPVQAKMYPATTPKRPHFVQLRFAGRLNEAQRRYVIDYYGEEIGGSL